MGGAVSEPRFLVNGELEFAAPDRELEFPNSNM